MIGAKDPTQNAFGFFRDNTGEFVAMSEQRLVPADPFVRWTTASK